jgi:hypothetical protein
MARLRTNKCRTGENGGTKGARYAKLPATRSKRRISRSEMSLKTPRSAEPCFACCACGWPLQRRSSMLACERRDSVIHHALFAACCSQRDVGGTLSGLNRRDVHTQSASGALRQCNSKTGVCSAPCGRALGQVATRPRRLVMCNCIRAPTTFDDHRRLRLWLFD